MSRSLKRMGKSVGRCNRNAIAKHAVSDKRICNKMVKLLGRKVEKEMKEMCLLSTDSALILKVLIWSMYMKNWKHVHQLQNLCC